MAYSKPVALVPTTVEARGSHVARPDMEKFKLRQGTVSEVRATMHQHLGNVPATNQLPTSQLLQHCNVLYSFASKYGELRCFAPMPVADIPF